MSTGTALVNVRTPKATPADQHKGNYFFTPPEVLAYLAGETLGQMEMDIVLRFFGGELPSVPPVRTEGGSPDRSTSVPPAFAYPYGTSPAEGGLTDPPKKKLIRKVEEPHSQLYHAAEILVGCLDDASAYAVLTKLAERFGFELP
ncbi:DNA ligase [Pectobacterium phage Arno160]|uniref:DNA ligase n=1 Tax=Pectobacterium phage Arno160 TaxID=2488835 RepID=A0A3G8F1U5_9CAUD|nr:DNA ligase [Pectobacterium phage Arno160]AZF88073.1 DNA ligase [Pectobacterium phage Arno160]